jgi:RNA polymerase sigma-B factor
MSTSHAIARHVHLRTSPTSASAGTDGEDPLAAFRAYRRSRNRKQYDELIFRYLPFVSKIARRYVRPSASFEDVSQIGTIGLMNAVHTFDPGRGVKFETYAYHCIAGEIRHYLRDHAEAVQAPRWVRRLHRELMETVSRLQQEFGRTPTLGEIAVRMNLTDQGVLEILRAHDRTRIHSLTEMEEGSGIHRELIASRRYVSFQLPVEDRIVLMDAIAHLGDIQKKVVYYLFYLDLTQSEVAKKLSISQRHVSRLLAAALRRLSSLMVTP